MLTYLISKSSSGELSPSRAAYPWSFFDSFLSLRFPIRRSFLVDLSWASSLTENLNDIINTSKQIKVQGDDFIDKGLSKGKTVKTLKVTPNLAHLQSLSWLLFPDPDSDMYRPGNSLSTSGLSKSLPVGR